MSQRMTVIVSVPDDWTMQQLDAALRDGRLGRYIEVEEVHGEDLTAESDAALQAELDELDEAERGGAGGPA